MPARKTSGKSSTTPSKSSKKPAGKPYAKIGQSDKTGIIRPLYAVSIHAAVARGDSTEMSQLATYARKQLKDVQTALDALEQRIAKSSAK